MAKGGPRAVTQRTFEVRVHGSKRLPGPAHQDRRRHEQHGRDDARNMTDEFKAKLGREGASKR